MGYVSSASIVEKGFVILDQYDQASDPQEWTELEYIEWKSSGDTRFAPLASASGQIEANGFWNQTPPRSDKDGVWVASQVAVAPNLARRAQQPGANVGRCRVIELQPNSYANAIYNLHQDDNNRLNPEGSGWIVRAFFNLTDDPESFLILREDRYDPVTEIRVPLPAGAQIIVDTQRYWHAVWHTGQDPRYCLISSWESGPALDSYIEKYHGHNEHQNAALNAELVETAQAEVRRRLAERAAAVAERGKAVRAGVDFEP